MISFLIITCVALVIAICDVSELTLSESDTALLYVSDDYVENAEEENDKIFGDSTITHEINTDDLVDFDAAAQAEEALNRIYNGGK